MLKSDLITIARYLYGDIWQETLAKDLQIGTRTIRKWLEGGAIKDSIAKDICQLVRKKQTCTKIEKILKKYEN